MNASDLMLPPCGQAALDLAGRGWHVFPSLLDEAGAKKSHKKAEHSGGRKWGATTDPEEVRRDWRRWPTAGLGLVTGPKSGFFVVEADTAEGHDVDGIGNLTALIKARGNWPDTIEAESPSGSWHAYFRWPEGAEIINSAGQVAPGVDVRGDGGMVIGPPTIRPGRPQAYRWKNPPGLFDLGDCPAWLLDLCRKPSAPDPLSARSRALGPRVGENRAEAWASAALRDELGRLLTAPGGQRNHALNRAAFALGQIVGGGALDEEDVRGRLTGAALAIGLNPEETRATVASGLSAGIAEPRPPPESQARPRAPGGAEPPPLDGPEERDDPEVDEAPQELPAEADDLSHDALARDLGARSWDQNARHVAGWGQWLFWDGIRWDRDQSLLHMTRTRAYLVKRAEEITAWAERKAEALDPKEGGKLKLWAKGEARTLRNANTVAAVTSLARSNPGSAANPDDFDADTWVLGTPGGTVDLRTGELRPARRDDAIIRLTSVAPAAGRPERWLAFLREVFAGDDELVAFIQRAAGYSLTGETSEHRLLFPYGSGANGKSTCLETLFRICGDYARRIPAVSLLNSNGERHPTDLAGLRGARFVAGSELPRGKSWDESAIKDLTGGDVVTARFMRQDFFDFRPQFTLWIAGNTLPSFKGVDEALRRRVVLVPFNVTIPPEQRDPDLPKKLEAEAGQILAWAVEGALEWQRRGLAVPERVATASREYLDGEDTLGQFLADATEADARAFVTTTALHERFRWWAEKQGLQPWTLRTLQKEVAARGFTVLKRNTGNGFLGLRLT